MLTVANGGSRTRPVFPFFSVCLVYIPAAASPLHPPLTIPLLHPPPHLQPLLSSLHPPPVFLASCCRALEPVPCYIALHGHCQAVNAGTHFLFFCSLSLILRPDRFLPNYKGQDSKTDSRRNVGKVVVNRRTGP